MDAEVGTRLVGWSQGEQAWARNRPHPERPPLPRVGQQVWWRRQHWDEQAVPALVVAVQDPADTTVCDITSDGIPVRDPNLWHLVRDIHSQPLHDGDRQPRYVPVADPWPLVTVRLADGTVETNREARLRGSSGWLPDDYRTRPERTRLPEQTLKVPRPPLPALNLPQPAGG